MVIGLAETHIIWEDKESNLKKLSGYVAAFSGRTDEMGFSGDKLILFPEMSLTGFSMNTELTREGAKETVLSCGEIARGYKTAIGVGYVAGGSEELCTNRYSIVDTSGSEILDYTKIHPFAYSGEDRYFKGGDCLANASLGGFTVGALICFDLRFPEIFQCMSDTADLIVVPANWPDARSRAWKLLLSARAIENQCFIAGVNCCGMMDGQYYSGGSGIYSPDGDLIEPKAVLGGADIAPYWHNGNAAPVYEDYERLYIYDIDNSVADARKSFPVKSARRPDIYVKYEKL